MGESHNRREQKRKKSTIEENHLPSFRPLDKRMDIKWWRRLDGGAPFAVDGDGNNKRKKRGNKLVRKEIEIIFKLPILNVFGGNY